MQKPIKGVAFVLLSTPIFWLLMKVGATFLGQSLSIAPLTVSDKQTTLFDFDGLLGPAKHMMKSNTLDTIASPYSSEFESLDWVESGEDEDEYEVSVVKKYTDSSSRAGVLTTVREVKKRIIKDGQVHEYIDSRSEESDETRDEGNTIPLQEQTVEPGEKEQYLNTEQENTEQDKESKIRNGNEQDSYGIPLDLNEDALYALEAEMHKYDFISSDLFFEIICKDDNKEGQEKALDDSSIPTISPVMQINYNDCSLDKKDYNTADQMAVPDMLDGGGDTNGVNKKEDCGIVDFNILNLYLDYGTGNSKPSHSLQRQTGKDVNGNRNLKERTREGSEKDDDTLGTHEHSVHDENNNIDKKRYLKIQSSQNTPALSMPLSNTTETSARPLKQKLSVAPKAKSSPSQRRPGESDENIEKEHKYGDIVNGFNEQFSDTVEVPQYSKSDNTGVNKEKASALKYKDNKNDVQHEDIATHTHTEKPSLKTKLADSFVTSNIFFLANKKKDYLQTSNVDDAPDLEDPSFKCRPFQGWFTRRCHINYREWMADLVDMYT